MNSSIFSINVSLPDYFCSYRTTYICIFCRVTFQKIRRGGIKWTTSIKQHWTCNMNIFKEVLLQTSWNVLAIPLLSDTKHFKIIKSKRTLYNFILLFIELDLRTCKLRTNVKKPWRSFIYFINKWFLV